MNTAKPGHSQDLLVKAAASGRSIATVTPESARWNHVGFAAYRLKAGESLALHEAARETCIVVMAGRVDIVDADGTRWDALGSRDSVFEDSAPAALYLPPDRRVTITATRDTELGVASAPGTGRFPPRRIEPGEMKRSVRGIGANTRYVCDILPRPSRPNRCWWSRCARPRDTPRATRRTSTIPTTCRSRASWRRPTTIA